MKLDPIRLANEFLWDMKVKKKIVDSQYLAWKIKQIIIFEYGTDNILIWDIINVI